MLAHLSDPYTGTGTRVGSPGHVEFIGISTPTVGKSVYLETRPWKDHAAPDLLEERFRIAQSTLSYDQLRKRIPGALVAAVTDIAEGWDFGLAGEWFYLQRQPWWDKLSNPQRIHTHFDMAIRLIPYVELLKDPKTAPPAPPLPDTAKRRKAQERAQARAAETDRRARDFVEKLQQQQGPDSHSTF